MFDDHAHIIYISTFVHVFHTNQMKEGTNRAAIVLRHTRDTTRKKLTCFEMMVLLRCWLTERGLAFRALTLDELTCCLRSVRCSSLVCTGLYVPPFFCFLRPTAARSETRHTCDSNTRPIQHSAFCVFFVPLPLPETQKYQPDRTTKKPVLS